MKSLCAVSAALLLCAAAAAKEFDVRDASGIRAAMKSAQPGDVISIKPGEYDVGDCLITGNSGTKESPITMRAAGEKGYARLTVTGGSDVGFRVLSRHWVLRGLWIEGNLKSTLDLIQIDATRGGSELTMIDCRVSRCSEFLFKASRSAEKGADDVVLEHCEWFDCPETAVDVVGGDRWVVRGNYVHDYGKDGKAHYGIFLKGGGKDGLIEGNLVDGKGGRGTIGISFGGGLTGRKWLPTLPDGKVAPEHANGVARNNIVANTGDCAYHSNNASGCRFYNNLAFNCGAGFQRQGSYPPDPALVNNVFSGGIRGAGESKNNLTKLDKGWFAKPEENDFRLSPAGVPALAGKGEALKDNPVDFFLAPRKTNDLGPVNATPGPSTRWVDRRM